jgi:hypothetical protein
MLGRIGTQCAMGSQQQQRGEKKVRNGFHEGD